MVDRAEPGARHHHDRKPERAGEVADVVAGRDRDEQPPDALDDDHLAVAVAVAVRGGEQIPLELAVRIGSPASSAARCGDTAGP